MPPRRSPGASSGGRRAAPYVARRGSWSVAELLRVDRVTISYPTENGTFIAVQDVSFAVAPGEKFILLGPSGCGKSTLLKAVAGFLKPSAGSLELEGRPIVRPGPDRVVIFQEFDQLLPWKTVLRNVMYPLQVARRMGEAEAREEAFRFVKMVGLERFAEAYPHQLSGGMKQRVAIARSLALDPRMLLMDEPFASLDAMTRRKMQEEVLALWEATGKTILFVTHSLQEAVLLGDRILVLSPGPGRVRQIVANPAAGRRDEELTHKVQHEVQAILELPEPGERAE